MTAKPKTIDEYLAPLGSKQRTALEKLRRAIQSAAPRAEECISYQIPTFRLDGRMLVSFAAWKSHCAFYTGTAPIRALKDELADYELSKGTIRFQADDPLPAGLVRKLVKVQTAARAVPATKRRPSRLK